MRVQKDLVLALYGASCTGKTSIAKALAEDVNATLRHCGNALRARARNLGVAINELSDDVHNDIDAATVEWVKSQNGMRIAEGRFLDQVLASRAPVCFVRLEASLQERCARWNARTGLAYAIKDLAAIDVEDEAFRQRMYGNAVRREPDYILDTTGYNVEDGAKWLRDKILYADRRA